MLSTCLSVGKQALRKTNSIPSACTTLYYSTSNTTVEDSLQKWSKLFKDANVTEPNESIASLLAHTLRLNRIEDVYQRKRMILSEDQEKSLQEMCKKRLENQPIKYIVGEWEFHKIKLKMRSPVFIPWWETERLIDIVADYIQKHNIKRALEFCSGTGAICLALLRECPQLEIVTIDKSIEACTLTKENANLLNLQSRLTVENKLLQEYHTNEKFDLIVSNPPYVPNHIIRTLTPEITPHEDLDALKGGDDGLNLVMSVINVSTKFLNPGGRLFLEVNPSHPPLIQEQLMKNKSLGLRFHDSYKDLSNIPRYVEIVKE